MTSAHRCTDIGQGGKPTSFGVILEAQHDFGRAVPSRRDILSHVPGIFLGINREATRQTEIANLQFAVGVDKQVSWLEIAMENVG